MKFNFKIQQYQIRDRGKVKAEPYQIAFGMSDEELEVIDPLNDTGYKNEAIELSDEQLLHNIQTLQRQNNIKLSASLVKDLGRCSLDMLNTGLRSGEALALRYDDFDFEAHTVRIERNAVQVKKRDRYSRAQGGYDLRIQTPKTRASRDTIPLNDAAIGIIRDMRAEEPKGYSGYIIHDEGSTKPIGARAFAKRFDNLLRLAEVEHCGLHSLRHTYASKAFEATGGKTKFVSEMLRHKDVAFTANQYVTLLDSYKEKMVAAITI